MLLPEVKNKADILYCPYMVHQEICYTNYELAYAIIAVAKYIKVSATELRIISHEKSEKYPDYDVYYNGNFVGCIYWFLPW